jgi:YhcH/YjgK/YiaL family protein
MKKIVFIIFTLISPLMAYSGTPDTTIHAVSKEKQDWFEEEKWRKGFSAKPDASVDINAYYDHYRKYTHLWEMIFTFLAETDLGQLDTGRYPLAGDSLFMIVDEYRTQDVKERKYEAHRKYIDLQYLVSGKELIGIAKLDDQEVLVPYNKEHDIAFFRVDEGDYRLADSSVFFIFFPDDIHQPCVNADRSTPVRKIVFKIISDH